MEVLVRQQRTTLAEVAQAAGVSVATVSKVLNDRTDVAQPTRARVRQMLEEAAYRPTGRGGRRADAYKGLIEVVFHKWQNAYTTAVLEGLTAVAQAEGFGVVVGQPRNQSFSLNANTMRNSGRVGAVFITFDPALEPIRSLVRDGFPVVTIDPLRVSNTECISIGATNFTGGVNATEHLLSLGHRCIAHAGGPGTVTCSQARLAGHLSALRHADIQTDESLVTHSDFSYDGGREVAVTLLDRAEPPTAIFAACDEIALGIMEEARRRSIRVPEDLSLIGFDDTFLAKQSTPPLTTMAQPLLEMGRMATRAMSQLINGEVQGARHIELATHLVVRDSTAPPLR
jgi:LacI family transcriptional regulator